MAAADEAELTHMIATTASIDESPSAVRYPRGEGTGVEIPKNGKVLEIGKGRIVQKGKQIAILSLGTRLQESLKAADEFAVKGLSCTVGDARFEKPLDLEMVRKLAHYLKVYPNITFLAISDPTQKRTLLQPLLSAKISLEKWPKPRSGTAPLAPRK